MTISYKNIITDQLQSIGTLMPVRQAILSSEVDSSCYADFLEAGTGLAVNLNAADSPLRLVFSSGFGDYGPLDYLGSVSSDVSSAFSGLAASTTNYLYVERDASTGDLSYGATTLVPHYSYARPSSPSSGQHHFNIPKMVMDVYDGADWEEKQRVFVGEAVTDGSSVTSVISYALQGKYDSGWFSVSTSTNYTKSHNIGIAIPDGLNVQFYYSTASDGSDASYAHDITAQGAGSAGHGCLENTTYETRNTIKIGMPDKTQYFKSTLQTGGYYRIVISRMW